MQAENYDSLKISLSIFDKENICYRLPNPKAIHLIDKLIVHEPFVIRIVSRRLQGVVQAMKRCFVVTQAQDRSGRGVLNSLTSDCSFLRKSEGSPR